MGRAERRFKAKQNKKESDKKVEAMRWINTLPPAKGELIKAYANMLADKHNSKFIDAIDRCFSAAIIVEQEHLSWEEIADIKMMFSYLMKEDANKMGELQKEYEGDIEMAIKKVNEHGPVVEERIRELIAEGKNQKESIEILRIEFCKLSNAMLTNAYKKTKQMIKDENKAIKVEEAIKEGEKVNEIVKKLGNPDVNTEKALEYIFEEKEEEYAPEQLDQEIEEAKEDGLEVINEVRIVDLKGKYATYHTENKIVEVNGELSFTSDTEVMEWATDEIRALEDKIAAINEQAKETIRVIKKYL